MKNRGVREKSNRPTFLPHSSAVVQILEVQEVPLVESAYVDMDGFLCHHAGSRNRLNLGSTIGEFLLMRIEC